jgi:undecaprenyl diphosphate synthase
MEVQSVKHVAIIMDGNGRWAQQRRHPRVWGHIRGSAIVSDIVEEADELGLSALTLYAFSSENWSRPFTEVTTLFGLLKKFLLKEKKRILENKIKFRVIGEISQLPCSTRDLIASLEEETKDHQGLKLTFAFGYGSRNEIVDSVNTFIKANPGKEISCEDIRRNLSIPDCGEVDLLIRTGGDFRVSNFLLWQIAYAELFFTETKWPDFTTNELRQIVLNAGQRERRFGTTEKKTTLEAAVVAAERNKRLIAETVRN